MDHRAKRDLTNELDRWSGIIDQLLAYMFKNNKDWDQ
jgi:hypothetical protein